MANMKKLLRDTLSSRVKKAMPILSFPSVQLMGISVRELISSSELQAKGMKLVADRVDSMASLSMMDLSVEAEAFGSKVNFSDNEVPTVLAPIVTSEEEADALKVPEPTAGRTGIYIDAIKRASKEIADRPVVAGIIGPFSLAGRLLDVSEAMIYCYDEPDMVHKVLEKATEFLIAYAREYREAGAAAVAMAEPLAGLLSPSLNAEFSVPYVKRIVEAVSDENFAFIYHNCGDGVLSLIGDILKIGADAYHFGNAIDIVDMLEKVPSDTIVMGNIDPAGQFCKGTVESISRATLELLRRADKYPNFIISSGCDIPPQSKWENIDAFFKTVGDFYAAKA